jgi:hypothetical protein
VSYQRYRINRTLWEIALLRTRISPWHPNYHHRKPLATEVISHRPPLFTRYMSDYLTIGRLQVGMGGVKVALRIGVARQKVFPSAS